MTQRRRASRPKILMVGAGDAKPMVNADDAIRRSSRSTTSGAKESEMEVAALAKHCSPRIVACEFVLFVTVRLLQELMGEVRIAETLGRDRAECGCWCTTAAVTL